MRPFPCWIGVHRWRVRSFTLVPEQFAYHSRLAAPAIAEQRCQRCEAMRFAIIDVAKART